MPSGSTTAGLGAEPHQLSHLRGRGTPPGGEVPPAHLHPAHSSKVGEQFDSGLQRLQVFTHHAGDIRESYARKAGSAAPSSTVPTTHSTPPDTIENPTPATAATPPASTLPSSGPME